LLAQVDSSVGGKTGVNHALGKNMIGAFYQPKCVVADVNVLKTLPKREFSAGLAEVIKYGLIANKAFYLWLKENISRIMQGEREALSYAIKVSCECKASVVSSDETEKGIRAILNLGHTFGHAIEAYYQYQKILHGEAVAIGTCMAAHLSCQLGYISKQEVEDIKSLFRAAQLPVSCIDRIPCEDLYEFMQVD
jgi:3-dehydroquinate synthase